MHCPTTCILQQTVGVLIAMKTVAMFLVTAVKNKLMTIMMSFAFSIHITAFFIDQQLLRICFVRVHVSIRRCFNLFLTQRNLVHTFLHWAPFLP